MNASEVSRPARIPYSKVYEALESLSERGWVERQRSRPMLYTAKPPEAAMEELRSRSESERREREKLVLKELAGVYERRGQQERPEVWILRGNNEILARLRNTLANCKTELMIAMPGTVVSYAKDISPLLAASKERGVRCMIMTSNDAPAEALREMSQSVEVRTRETMYGGGLVADAKEVILLLGVGEGANSSLAIWADHPGLAGFARDYFEFLWNSSETIEISANGTEQLQRRGQRG